MKTPQPQATLADLQPLSRRADRHFNMKGDMMSLMYGDVTSNKGEAAFCSALATTRPTWLLRKRPSNLEKGHRWKGKDGTLPIQVEGYWVRSGSQAHGGGALATGSGRQELSRRSWPWEGKREGLRRKGVLTWKLDCLLTICSSSLPTLNGSPNLKVISTAKCSSAGCGTRVPGEMTVSKGSNFAVFHLKMGPYKFGTLCRQYWF